MYLRYPRSEICIFLQIVFENLFIFILLALLNRLVIKNLLVPALHQKKKLSFTALTGIHAEMMPLSFEQPRNQNMIIAYV
ncbi:hypothetical protein T02_14791 [Trichinella nativa]|uniref:Uncharacterized protein n=1 Tax=Trichinella nativa TaxID=6335 RepID=A0A0V1LBN7_9BILA|nr:hypothetical protein T02_14791 [Trichinella nativa]